MNNMKNVNKVLKSHELTLDINPRSRTNIATSTTFFSMDVNTAKKVINFTHNNEPVDLTDATILIGFEFVGVGTSKIIDSEDGTIIIEDTVAGQCLVNLPNHLYQYEGQVLVHVYIKYADGRSLDCGIIVTEFEESWLDSELEEMTEFYVQRFENLANDIKERASMILVDFEEVETMFRNLKSELIAESSEVLRKEVEFTILELKQKVKAEIVARELEFTQLSDEIKATIAETFKDLNTATEIKQALVQLMQEVGEQFELDVTEILKLAENIRAELAGYNAIVFDVQSKLDNFSERVDTVEEHLTYLKENGIADSGWLDLELLNGVEVYGDSTPQYRRMGDLVHLRGAFSNILQAETTASRLPIGFRPTGQNHIFIQTASRKNAENAVFLTDWKIDIDGNITLMRNSNRDDFGVDTWFPINTLMVVDG